MLWLHGSAGIGKSAIAQKFAGYCGDYGRLGASFFFKKGHSERGTSARLIPSIAYQLISVLPELLVPLQQAIENDRLVLGRAMTIQFQRLLVEPFRQISGLAFRPIIVLDSLDECDNQTHQQTILRDFISALETSQLPVRLFVASRPELHIQDIFTDVTDTLCRQELLSAGTSALHDIRTYLQDEFSKVATKFNRRGIHLREPWPAKEILDHLVDKSSGIFIYAATVIRFIAETYSHPAERLASMLSLDPSSTAPLDDLYTKILSTLPEDPALIRILYIIAHPNNRDIDLLPDQIDWVLQLFPGKSIVLLSGSQSLIEIPPTRPYIDILHASFTDYLCDPHPSGSWCIAAPWLPEDLL